MDMVGKRDDYAASGLPLLETQDPTATTGGLFAKGSQVLRAAKIWRNAVQSTDCDVCLILGSRKTDKRELLSWMMDHISKEPGLQLRSEVHQGSGNYAIYVTADQNLLLKGADEMEIQKPWRSDLGGGTNKFSFANANSFDGVDGAGFLNSKERAMVTFKVLCSIRAEAADVIEGVTIRKHDSILARLRQTGLVSQVFCPHNRPELEYLKKNWVSRLVGPQPLDKVKNYFGEEIAMYFAFLGHYTVALVVPALIGILHWFYFGDSNGQIDDVGVVLFALVNIVWGTVYLESWKRHQAEFAYHWGTITMDNDLLEEPRSEFIGTFTHSPITGRHETYYPVWKRRLFRYAVSYPVTFCCLGVMCSLMLCLFRVQELLDSSISASSFLSWVTFLPKVALAVTVSIADDLYSSLAKWLNRMENYRTDTAFENSLIVKTVLFQFLNSFLPLFYIAFYLNDMERLKSQLAALLITKQIIGNIKEAIIPLFLEKVRFSRVAYSLTNEFGDETAKQEQKSIEASPPAFKEKSPLSESESESNPIEEVDDRSSKDSQMNRFDRFRQGGLRHRRSPNRRETDKAETPVAQTGRPPVLTQAEVDSMMPPYESPLGDYLEMFIQFGLVLLFSPAFPLAALCALLNNIIEIHVDSFKLCNTLQRPFGKRVSNIGSWQAAMEAMGIIGVIVNCVIIGNTGVFHRLFPGISFVQQLLLIVFMEHAVFAIKLGLDVAIPDIPHWVSVEIAKEEFKRRDALRKQNESTPSSHKYSA